MLPGLPAAMLLVAFALSLLPPRLHCRVLMVLVLAWLPADWRLVVASVPRPRQPYRELDARLESWAEPGDVVLVHSIPSGVIGVARYLDRATSRWRPGSSSSGPARCRPISSAC